jgi:hypothetical protein
MKSFSSMVLTAPKYQQGPLEVPYMSSMSHTNGTNTTNVSSISKSKESPLRDNVGGVGGWNHNPHLINLSANLPLESKSQHLFCMKP